VQAWPLALLSLTQLTQYHRPRIFVIADALVVVICARGGSMEAKGGRYGFESRSLKAAHLLQQAGYTNVMHLKVKPSFFVLVTSSARASAERLLRV